MSYMMSLKLEFEQRKTKMIVFEKFIASKVNSISGRVQSHPLHY